MSRNNGNGEPQHGTKGQSMAQSIGKGGANMKAKPFGMKNGSSRNSCDEPQYGCKGQRLSGGTGGKATGFPPGYTSR